MPQADQRQLEEAMKKPEISKQSTDLGVAIEKLASSLAQLTTQVRDAAAQVLQSFDKSNLKTKQ